MKDSTNLSDTEQARALNISIMEFYRIWDQIESWLLSEPTLMSQVYRVTDVRLTEILPPLITVSCKRCGISINTVPCVECISNCSEAPEISHISGRAWSKLESDRGFPDPPRATQAMPGSARKIKIMRERASKGYGIFHPDDLYCDDVSRLENTDVGLSRRDDEDEAW